MHADEAFGLSVVAAQARVTDMVELPEARQVSGRNSRHTTWKISRLMFFIFRYRLDHQISTGNISKGMKGVDTGKRPTVLFFHPVFSAT